MSTSEGDELAPGVVFGKYQIVKRIGEGGMGTVWKATHLGLKKPVVIKSLRSDMAKDKEARNRFLREGEAAARIRHPHVVEIHDVGLRNDVPYLVMEHLDGEDLGARIGREGIVPVGALADMMLPVIAAVSAAHEEGVVHRDLKPENIFLSVARDGSMHPKVLDFGVSRVVNDQSGRIRTQADALIGTLHYMSPEQARGERLIDDRSDQYALGVILYECATGRPPVRDAAMFVMLQRIATGQFPPPRKVRPDLPEAFEAIVLRAMELDPSARFPSLLALGVALLPFASDRSRVLWTPCFDALGDGDAARTIVALDGDATLPQMFGAELVDTIVEEGSEREVATLPMRTRWAKRRSVVVAGLVGAVAVAATIAAWTLGRR